MHSARFSQGHATNLNVKRFSAGRQMVEPYDNDMKFTKILNPRDEASRAIWSIDPESMQRAISRDQLDALYALTLPCVATRNGIGVWDILFNSRYNRSLTACIFMANAQYAPIPRDRVVTTSAFLDFRKPTSRVSLNDVRVDDRVGIAIHDLAGRFTYVLLYQLTGLCSIIRTDAADGDRPHAIDAVNLALLHAFEIDRDGSAERLDIVPDDAVYDSDTTQPFVTWLADSVQDIKNAYPWKPHYVPQSVSGINPAQVEARYLHDAELVKDTTYDEFEAVCRQAYYAVKENARTSPAPQRMRKRPGASEETPVPARQNLRPPVIEVLMQEETITAKIGGRRGKFGNADSVILRFPKSSMEGYAAVESHLLGYDLDGVSLVGLRDIAVMSEENFGKRAYIRYFTLNF